LPVRTLLRRDVYLPGFGAMYGNFKTIKRSKS